MRCVMGISGRTRDIVSRLDRIELLLRALTKLEQGEAIMLEALRAEVAETRGHVESAKVFIAGLKAKIEELAARPTVDPAELAALASVLDATNNDFAAAIVNNPPA